MPDAQNTSRGKTSSPLTVREKAGWGLGGLPEVFYVWGVQQLIYPIYNIAFGLSPALIGLALAIRTLWDAFTDPLMGHISDRTRSRWGRRRPFMVAGILGSAVAFVAIWWIPAWVPKEGLFVYLLATLLVFTTASTIYFVPYLALGYGLTDDAKARTSLQAYRLAFLKIGSFTVPWLYFLTQLDIFPDTRTGVRVLALIAAVLFLACGLASTLLVRERDATPAEQSTVGFVTALKQIGRNRTLGHFLLMILLLGQSTQVVNSLSLYVIIYHMFDGDKQAAAALYATGSTFYFFASFAAIPATAWLAGRIGRVRTLQISCAIVCVASLSKWVLFSDSQPYLIFLVYILMAPGLSGFNLLRAAMVADLVDDDEHRNGARRTGLLAAVDQWSFKVTAALALLLTGVILQSSGFDAAAPQQTEETLFSLRAMFALIPAAGALLSLWLAVRYPLDDARMETVRAELAARRA